MNTQKELLNVNIRMYCHGLGDCFLLTFEKGQKKFNMLIDCGILQQTPKEKDIMQTVAKDIKSKSDGILDLVVATHEHHDHICGFAHAGETFDEIDFKEVWVAWTEDPTNELAQTLRSGSISRLNNLSKAIEQMKSLNIESSSSIEDLLQGFSGDAIAAAKENKRAKGLEYVLTKNTPNTPKYKYCYPGKSTLSLAGFEEEVRVYVLGPPTEKEKLRDLSAPQTEKFRHGFAELLINDGFSMEESFFSAFENNDEFPQNSSPFDAGIGLNSTIVLNESDSKSVQDCEVSTFFQSNYLNSDNKWRTIEGDWLSMTSELALKMDSYTNNTSLVLAIELVESGKVLLFAADAQFGNWKAWHDYSWEITEKDGKIRKVGTKDLLEKTVVYKVGHHGSHNATLRESGLEMMTNQELVALIPVDSERAKEKKWEMPFDILLEELQKKTKGRVIASDRERLTDFLPETADKNWGDFEVDSNNKLFSNTNLARKLFIDFKISG